MHLLLLLLLSLRLFAVSTKECSSDLLSFETKNGMRYALEDFEEMDADTSLECAQICQRSANCRSANFDRMGGLCELTTADMDPNKSTDKLEEISGYVVLYNIRCEEPTTTAQPASALPKSLKGQPKEPIRKDCQPLSQLSFDARPDMDVEQPLLDAKEASNLTQCAHHCYKRTALCTAASYDNRTGVCILKSAVLDKAQGFNSSEVDTKPTVVNPHIILITNVTCSKGEADERFFGGYYNPFINWFYRQYCYQNGNNYGYGYNNYGSSAWGQFGQPCWPTPVAGPPTQAPFVFPEQIYNTFGSQHTTHPPRTTTTTSVPPPPRCGRPSIVPLVSGFSLRTITEDAARIIGGSNARAHSWPWQASLLYYGHHLCGGSLIDSNHILTAAHCFKYGTTPDYYSIHLGSHTVKYLESGEQRFNVRKIILHPQYGKPKNAYDMAIVVLNRSAQLSETVQAICLAESEARSSASCVVAGWGDTDPRKEEKKAPRVLQQVVVPLMATQKCNSKHYYNGRIHATMFCAGYAKGGKDSCQGDSGGPLVCPDDRGGWIQHGVVSWGKGCAVARKPGVYASVAKLRSWILRNTQEN